MVLADFLDIIHDVDDAPPRRGGATAALIRCRGTLPPAPRQGRERPPKRRSDPSSPPPSVTERRNDARLGQPGASPGREDGPCPPPFAQYHKRDKSVFRIFLSSRREGLPQGGQGAHLPSCRRQRASARKRPSSPVAQGASDQPVAVRRLMEFRRTRATRGRHRRRVGAARAGPRLAVRLGADERGQRLAFVALNNSAATRPHRRVRYRCADRRRAEASRRVDAVRARIVAIVFPPSRINRRFDGGVQVATAVAAEVQRPTFGAVPPQLSYGPRSTWPRPRTSGPPARPRRP